MKKTDQCSKCSAHGDYTACVGLDCGKRVRVEVVE